MADAELEAQLAVFRSRFLARLDDTLDTLDAQLRGHGAGAPPVVLREALAQLHQLAGGGGTFGFAELSRQARLLELQVQAWLDADAAIPALEWETWKSAVSGLRQSVTAADPPKGPVPRQST
jgi:HPt (histidine-containing phosphotransfer) domain-containing protein